MENLVKQAFDRLHKAYQFGDPAVMIDLLEELIPLVNDELKIMKDALDRAKSL